MLEAVALRRPHEAPVAQEAQAVVQRHPGVGGFAGERALLAGGEPTGTDGSYGVWVRGDDGSDRVVGTLRPSAVR